MRHLIKLILSFCFCFNVLAQTDSLNGRVTAYKFSDGLKYQTYQVDKKTFITNGLDVLKTYEIDVNTFEINTATNEFISLLFANNCIVKVDQNSEFRVDLMNLTVKGTNEYPSKVTVDSCNLNMSLIEGEALFNIVKSNTNDQIILQTSLSNLGLENGKYYIQSTKKSVVVYILEGSLVVFDNVTNKKELIKEGSAVLIHPSPTLTPKQLALFADSMTTTVKKVKPEQFKPFLDEVNGLESIRNEIIFIHIDSKVVGVKVK